VATPTSFCLLFRRYWFIRKL